MPPQSTPFHYQGRGLEHWLRELVTGDGKRRRLAAEAIEELRFRPSGLGEKSPHGQEQVEAFDAAVREAIHSPGFEVVGFLRSLIGLLNQPSGTAGHQGNAQDLFRQSLAAAFVFLALREEILLVPDEIRGMLRDPRRRWNAMQVIQRLGPQAGLFADDLMAQLDGSQSRRPFDAPDALAAVIRDDASRIAQLVDRLASSEPAVAEAAADTLYSLGPRAAELVPACVDALLSAVRHKDSPIRPTAAAALGRVTSGTEVAVEDLLALSRDADPRAGGAALTALGDIGRQAERVVPRLVEALNDYREEDPDWLHYSQHDRVVRALQAFGPAASAALPALVARLRRGNGEPDRGVLHTLVSMGPAAREHLPLLIDLADEEGYTDEDLASPDELDSDADAVAWAIVQIRAHHTR